MTAKLLKIKIALIWKSLRSIFAWKLIKSMSFINEYFENTVTGDRKVHTPTRGCMQPINFMWLSEAPGRGWCYDRWDHRDYIDRGCRRASKPKGSPPSPRK